MPERLFSLQGKAGIKRDGTQFEGSYYTGGEWSRFNNQGKPRKIGGYRELSSGWTGPIRGMHAYTRNGQLGVHAGNPSTLLKQLFAIDGSLGSGIVDRTPSGFVASSNNIWTMDSMFDAGSNGTRIIAHAAPNLTAVDQETNREIYYGDITGTGALTVAGDSPSVSGGIVVLHPFLFAYGTAGDVAWSDTNLPDTWSGGEAGDARISESKIVAAKPTRAGSNSPSGLFWTLDSVIRCSFVGSPAVFKFDTISSESSILSQQAIVEYDGMFFWPGVDRFLAYNGVVRELPNNVNLNFFFDNINYAYRQKVFGFKVPRWGEIWWVFPKGVATEPNHALIFNTRLQTWYDTPFPEAAYRTSGVYNQVFRYPIMADGTAASTGNYSLWQHEYGYDKIVASTAYALDAFIDTPNIAFASTGPTADQWTGVDRWARMTKIEPDFNQIGNVTMTVLGKMYAQSVPDGEDAYTLSEGLAKLDINPTGAQRREMRLRFASNDLGGFYEIGQPLLHISVGDGRQGGADGST